MRFITELKRRNGPLFWFGLFNLAVGFICVLLMLNDPVQVMNISRWVKPMKFYFSVGIMIWTMGWLIHYLDSNKKKKRYTWLLIISMFFENALILVQAIRGTTSHFNVSSSFDGIIFNFMGIFILLFTITVILIFLAFFRQKQFAISEPYLWSIRLGILLFIIFSLEGGIMLTMLKHTVGGDDGSPGIPIVNWSKDFGDLRIAHFLGIHALQALPLFGYYLARTKNQVFFGAGVYLLLVLYLLYQALKGTSILNGF